MAPVITNLIQDKWSVLNDKSFGILDGQSSLRMITWPILNGMWGAVMASLVASAVFDHERAYGWIVAGICVPAVLSALYLFFSNSTFGVVPILISILGFVAYLKVHQKA